jgi:hypothetical protein
MADYRSVRMVALLVALVLALAACSSDDDAGSETTAAQGGSGEGPVANACPADGCSIEILEVGTEGEELAVTWGANFLPDVSKNHIHIYWDIFTADQVSSDAEARGVVQGDWHPTDAYPSYVTESGARSSIGVTRPPCASPPRIAITPFSIPRWWIVATSRTCSESPMRR